MRDRPKKLAEQSRVKDGPWASDKSLGCNGLFRIPFGQNVIRVLASDGARWDHVSVSIEHAKRCPNYVELVFIKKLFWGCKETVMQLHVPDEDHVNYHEYCLHLWRPQNQEIPRPPAEFVGPTTPVSRIAKGATP